MDSLIEQLRNSTTRRAAFDVLVRTYSERLYWTIRHITIRHDLADDALQNTFVKAWSALDHYRGDAQPSTWLHRIAVNEAMDTLRRENQHHVGEGDEHTLDHMFADEYFDGDEVERLLRRALDTLPEAQRTVFIMKYYEDMSYKEISEILGTTEGGLKANYHHAVEKIKAFMENTN